MTTLRDERVRIRKPHTCPGCGLRWAPGTEMDAVVCVDMGKVYTCYWCDVCTDMVGDWLDDDMYTGLPGEIRSNNPNEWLAIARRCGLVPALCAG